MTYISVICNVSVSIVVSLLNKSLNLKKIKTDI